MPKRPTKAPPPPVVTAPPAAPAPVFELCPQPELQRLLRLLEGAMMITDLAVSNGMRISLAAHQVAFGLAGTDDPATHAVLLQAFCDLVNRQIGGKIILAVAEAAASPSPG